MQTLHFHCNASKAAFIAKNGFFADEILAETPASITIANHHGNFANSSFVFHVTIKN